MSIIKNAKIIDCIIASISGCANDSRRRLNMLFPIMPPIIDAIANKLAILKRTCSFFENSMVINDMAAIAKTVDADNILIVDTSSRPIVSRIGLMMTPPPMPAIEPRIDAKSPMMK